MKRTLLPLLALLALLLAGCSGNPLPQGMEEEDVLEQGRQVQQLLLDGDWQAVYDRLRQDARETASPEKIQALVEQVTGEAGAYVKTEDTMATGQELDDGEQYATAVFYCKHEKEDVLWRIAFDTEMTLMGLELYVT